MILVEIALFLTFTGTCCIRHGEGDIALLLGEAGPVGLASEWFELNTVGLPHIVIDTVWCTVHQ